MIALIDYGAGNLRSVEKALLAAGAGRLTGVQFHPEKSQAVGLAILRRLIEEGGDG
jgi:imidazoleglycerol phosphate synthase glutamine amidotransferase subunit HisH